MDFPSVQDFVQFKHPSSILVAGPSQIGKSYFVKRIIENADQLIVPNVQEIYWCCNLVPNWQLPRVKFITQIPDPAKLDPNVRRLIVIDDMMSASPQTQELIANYFTKHGHHTNSSLIYIVQNVFEGNRFHRTTSLNAHYIALFANRRDVTQFYTLGRQLFPRKLNYFQAAFDDATSEPYGYLLIDLKTPYDSLRMRTKIFPKEMTVAYQPLS
jgi:hypothetical protein